MKSLSNADFALMILDSLERECHTPIGERQLHAYAYFVNALAPLQDIEPRWARVYKWADGPYFPDLSEGLLQLEAEGLAKVTSETVSMPQIERVLSGIVLTSLGIKAVEERFGKKVWRKGVAVGEVDKRLEFIHEVSRHLHKLSKPPMELATDRIQDAIWADPSYAFSEIAIASTIDLETENYTLSCCEEFQKHVPAGVRLLWFQKIYLFFSYLSRVIDGQVEAEIDDFINSIG